jgi:hypothetical protein
MVGHTHHDFLPHAGINDFATHEASRVCLSKIKDFREAECLFDLSDGYKRKVNLSYLDEHLDDVRDWNEFIRPLSGIDCLYIVNDRTTINPIMREYGKELTRRYLSRLKEDGIHAEIVDPQL